MKIKLIALFSVAATITLLVVSNNSQSYPSNHPVAKLCKHNDVPYAMLPINQMCVYDHARINPNPTFHRAKESHLCVLTEQLVSGL